MKKFMVMAVSAAALVMLGACSNSNCNNSDCNSTECAAKTAGEKVVYTGVLPGADVDQVRYTLTLDYDDDNATKGDYDLVQTYQQADTTVAAGVKDVQNVRSEGDFTIITKDGSKYIKLVPDAKDSDASADTADAYFLIDNDSTITMVNSSLEKSVNTELNYSLTRTK